jgi:hypothetical protein
MARNGDGLFRRGGIWVFKYKDQTGIYREKSTSQRKQSEAGDTSMISSSSFARTSFQPMKQSGPRIGRSTNGWSSARLAEQAGYAELSGKSGRPSLDEWVAGGRTVAPPKNYLNVLAALRSTGFYSPIGDFPDKKDLERVASTA